MKSLIIRYFDLHLAALSGLFALMMALVFGSGNDAAVSPIIAAPVGAVFMGMLVAIVPLTFWTFENRYGDNNGWDRLWFFLVNLLTVFVICLAIGLIVGLARAGIYALIAMF